MQHFSDQDLSHIRLVVVERLIEQNPLLKPLLINLSQKMRLGLDVTFDSCTAYTDITEHPHGNNTYLITLGLGKMDKSVQNRIVYGSEFFDETELIKHRLLHELCHVFIAEAQSHGNKMVLSLIDIIKDQQHRTGKFFTGMSSFKNNGGFIQFLARITRTELGVEHLDEEDCVELLTMALWGTEYFQSYLDFMVDPIFKSVRSRMNMLTLTQESAEAIGGLVQSIVLQLPKFVAL